MSRSGSGMGSNARDRKYGRSPPRRRSRSRSRSRDRPPSRTSRSRSRDRPSRRSPVRSHAIVVSNAAPAPAPKAPSGPSWLLDLVRKKAKAEEDFRDKIQGKPAPEEGEIPTGESSLSRSGSRLSLTPARPGSGTPGGADSDIDVIMTPAETANAAAATSPLASPGADKDGKEGKDTGKERKDTKDGAAPDAPNGTGSSPAGNGQFEPDVESESERLAARANSLPTHIPSLMGCRSVHCYKRLNTIGGGMYGVVHRAEDLATKEIVALKKIKVERASSGFPITSLREINILLNIQHPGIVELREIVVGEKLDAIYMVMEYMDHDMKVLMDNMKQPFTQSEVKCLMLQLLEAIAEVHKNWVIHRDLKTSNLLMDNKGRLKICDFGLARRYGSPIGNYTPLVVTLWYRAPELLLGAETYGPAIDMWSVGCIFAELLTREPLMPGKGEFDQLAKIVDLMGSPSEEVWPGFSELRVAKTWKFKKSHGRLRQKFPKVNYTGGPYLTDTGFDLLARLLAYDPKQRITAEEALAHPWFKETPRPQDPRMMPSFPSTFEGKRKRESPDVNEMRQERDRAYDGFFLA